MILKKYALRPKRTSVCLGEGASRKASWRRMPLAQEEGHYSINVWLKHRLWSLPTWVGSLSLPTCQPCDLATLLSLSRPHIPRL